MSEPSNTPPESAAPEIRLLIVVPTYNNRPTLRDVVERALATGHEVLVVNDASTDGAPETLGGLPSHLIHLPVNGGKGAGVLAGARWASDHGFTHIITVDADGQHDPDSVHLFTPLIAENPKAVIVGLRDFSQVDVPWNRRLARKLSNFWLWVATGVPLNDSQSGLRAYPVETVTDVPCRSRRYDYEIELLARQLWRGAPLRTVKSPVAYSPEMLRASHFNQVWDNLRIFRTFTRLVLRQLLPWPHRKTLRPPQPVEEQITPKHPVRSIRTLLCQHVLPYQIMLAAMLGTFLGTLPLIGFHTITIAFFATRLRLNIGVAVGISTICMPPFVPVLAIETGYYLRHGEFLTNLGMDTLIHSVHTLLWEYLIGSLVIGPVLAVAVGLIAYVIAIGFHARRSPAPS